MYPYIEITSGFRIFTFGLFLSISILVFIGMIKVLSIRLGSNESFFFNRILWYFLSIILFSRVLYIISNWGDLKYINGPLELIFMGDYNMSLMGAIIGFLLVLFLSIIFFNLRSGKYIDIAILSFLPAATIGYIGAFLGGEVYGRDTDFGIEVSYNNSSNFIPYEVPIFPLAIVYSIVFIVLFILLYGIVRKISVRGIVGYSGFIFIGSIYMILENYNGYVDYFTTSIGLNLNQLRGVLMVLFGIHGLYRIYKTPVKISQIID